MIRREVTVGWTITAYSARGTEPNVAASVPPVDTPRETNRSALDDVILHVPAVEAAEYDLDLVEVDEGYVEETTSDPGGPNDPVEVLTTGQSGSFKDVRMQVHHMAIDDLALSGFTIEFQYDPDDGTFEYA